MRKFMLFVLVLCSVGCVSRATRNARFLDSIIGRPVELAIDNFGPPSNVYDEAPYKVYVWNLANTYGGISGFDVGQGADKVHIAGLPVRTSNTYRMLWVENGLVARWRSGVRR